MNICLCGTLAGYQHNICCPYPLYRGTSDQVIKWEMAWAVNKQAAQQSVQPTVESVGSEPYVDPFDADIYWQE
jgi:hypothetical protein